MLNCFTGTYDELQEYLGLDLYIGLTALSFRTDEQLEAIKSIPLDKILISTNGPLSCMSSKFKGYQYVKTQFNTVLREEYQSD